MYYYHEREVYCWSRLPCSECLTFLSWKFYKTVENFLLRRGYCFEPLYGLYIGLKKC